MSEKLAVRLMWSCILEANAEQLLLQAGKVNPTASRELPMTPTFDVEGFATAARQTGGMSA